MMRRMRKALAYFGLDGSATRLDWLRSAVEVVPPLVVAVLADRLDGVGGLAGWGLGALYFVVALTVWWLLVVQRAPWRRSELGRRAP